MRCDLLSLGGGGNVLGPKSMACFAKLEETKTKELATKLG